MDKVNGIPNARPAPSGKSEVQRSQARTGSPVLTLKEKVDRILEPLEKSPMAERLELLQFLLFSVASGAGGASSAEGRNDHFVFERTRSAMGALAAEKESRDQLRTIFLTTLKPSLPGYVNSKLDSLVTWPDPNGAQLDMVNKMRNAHLAGSMAMGHFSQCDNETKLKLLGFSHSRCYLRELGSLVTQYEIHKKQYLYPKEVGFAYKDGFNEALIEQLPENQKARFKDIMTETDYPTKRDLLEAAIVEFLPAPPLGEAHGVKAPGAPGTETPTTTTTTTTTTTITTTTTGTESDDALDVTANAASSTAATTATAPITIPENAPLAPPAKAVAAATPSTADANPADSASAIAVTPSTPMATAAGILEGAPQ